MPELAPGLVRAECPPSLVSGQARRGYGLVKWTINSGSMPHRSHPDRWFFQQSAPRGTPDKGALQTSDGTVGQPALLGHFTLSAQGGVIRSAKWGLGDEPGPGRRRRFSGGLSAGVSGEETVS